MPTPWGFGFSWFSVPRRFCHGYFSCFLSFNIIYCCVYLFSLPPPHSLVLLYYVGKGEAMHNPNYTNFFFPCSILCFCTSIRCFIFFTLCSAHNKHANTILLEVIHVIYNILHTQQQLWIFEQYFRITAAIPNHWCVIGVLLPEDTGWWRGRELCLHPATTANSVYVAVVFDINQWESEPLPWSQRL